MKRWRLLEKKRNRKNKCLNCLRVSNCRVCKYYRGIDLYSDNFIMDNERMYNYLYN